MSNILIRGVDRKVLARLKARAKRHGHSLHCFENTITRPGPAEPV